MWVFNCLGRPGRFGNTEKISAILLNSRFLRERGMVSNPKIEYQVFLCIFQKNSAMATLCLKEMEKFFWEGREKGLLGQLGQLFWENAKRIWYFEKWVGRHASFPPGRSINHYQIWSLLDYLFVFADFVSPITAAQTVLHSVCKKRKDVLPKTMDLLLSIVQNPVHTPSQKDGALHMIGTMADILLKKKVYKERMEQFLVNIVFPEFNSPHGHLRAR